MKAEVFKDKKGEFRFRLVARNGKILVQSEGYKEKRNALKTLNIVLGYSNSPTYFKDLTK